jgi:hypothetical protein
MGYWETSSGERYMVNIDQRLIRAMKDAGARFCWFKDNPGIDDETNEIFYEAKTEKGGDRNDQTSKVLREGITVTAENGENITGYISHWVENKHGETEATNIKNWFIFQPGTYPTSYIISDKDTN